MIDWKRKLTSRKFWTAIAEFVTMLIIALGGAQETAVQVTALIMAGAAVIAYIIGEGLTDAAAAKPQEEKPPATEE
jgi:threonine/homoserine/homoserine lactone efflux protein